MKNDHKNYNKTDNVKMMTKNEKIRLEKLTNLQWEHIVKQMLYYLVSKNHLIAEQIKIPFQWPYPIHSV